MRESNVRRLTLAGMMGAIAFVLMYLSFPIKVLSPFADFDFSYLPEIIGGFMLGPVGAVEIISVKIILKLIFKPTTTAFAGEFQKFLLSCAYVLPAVLYYRKNRTKRGAMISLVIGTIVGVIVAIITNLYIIFPWYINNMAGMSWESIIGMCTAVNPLIKDLPTMVAFSIVPFNVVSMGGISIIAMLVYKKISVPLKKFIQ